MDKKKFTYKILSYSFVFLFLISTSCKPHLSLSGATIPIEAKTISVGFFT